MRIELRNILKDYRLEDIFNCDETGLFWKMEPNRGLSTGPIRGIKQDKDRVTILLTCNSTGTEKLKPLFIHKFQTPRLRLRTDQVNPDQNQIKSGQIRSDPIKL